MTKTNRQKQDKTKPLTDSGIGVETKPFVKCKKVCEYKVKNKKEREKDSGNKEPGAYWKEKMHDVLFVRVEPRRNESP